MTESERKQVAQNWLDAERPAKELRVVELGCGPRKKSGALGVDLLPLAGVDIQADLNEGLRFLPDASVDVVRCPSILEHIREFSPLMAEIRRVLKPSGYCDVFVPHFSNPYYSSDPTHIRPFGLYTFFYFVEEKHQWRRKVPCFYGNTRILIEELEMVFTSPFRERRWFRRLFGALVNSSQFMKEFYEENLCYLVPCYGLRIKFRPAR